MSSAVGYHIAKPAKWSTAILSAGFPVSHSSNPMPTDIPSRPSLFHPGVAFVHPQSCRAHSFQCFSPEWRRGRECRMQLQAGIGTQGHRTTIAL
ncbi:uncharacterized protein BP01DRAFT_157155 [Aspergillus saccharolyticus JOP 1030-1]|uniref:Uncharacterized protein n=1 Tax=Aspergillus saccharolyticus JOP 1030-1 TaxID=1450539 RepID=A0A319A326_9EURO|nr:hypothetical protein BP01DRAFT_157155 [Aspergillus saccharolyticus JOP 1030-1]PYH41862.1 hypothetical protein BP01DRAFT_157155 [Aspergillus saccharolyticus JOP 1030-1]